MKIALVYKNLKTVDATISHVGLGVTAENTRIMLAQAGYDAFVLAVRNGEGLWAAIAKDPSITHVVMLAPWVDQTFVERMCRKFPKVKITMTCHSNVGFLQADRWAVEVVREGIELNKKCPNYAVSGNCRKFCDWVVKAYSKKDKPPAVCELLPNMYYTPGMPPYRPAWRGGVLRLGIFGAVRAQKNIMTAAGGALVIANESGASSTEIWMSSGREEGGAGVMPAVRQMLADVPGVELIEAGWHGWHEFVKLVGRMDLVIGPSYTESFCNVDADALSQGTPVVVSDAIDWLGWPYRARADEAMDVARVGLNLLATPDAAFFGYLELQAHNKLALQCWRKFLA